MHKKSSVIGNWYLGIWIFFITCLMKLLSSDLLQEVLKKRMIKKKKTKRMTLKFRATAQYVECA